MKKSFVSGLLTIGMAAMLLAGCGGASKGTEASAASSGSSQESQAQGGEAKSGEDIKFAVVFSTGGLGDKGFNDEVYQGCELAVEQFGCSFDYCEPKDVAEFETQLRMFADTEEYDVIITVSTDQIEALKMIAEDYPDQKFCHLDAPVEGSNINSLCANYPDQHFLSGMLAGIATQDERFPLADPTNNTIGFCIAIDSPVSRGQAAGFLAGARYVNPDVEILTNFIGNYNDPATAKELALVMYERGADIVSANAGASTQGVFKAAEEANRYVIGTSLMMADPAHSLSTSVKKIWLLLPQEIQMLVDGTWKPEVTVVGIPEGICDYDVEGLDVEIPDDVVALLDEAREAIKAGEFTLPTDLDQVDAWAAEHKLER